MANSMINPRKQMKRMESRKSHSWWWDSHISPKNNKWLAENLEEMDQSVKRMLKLIEGEGDSFAKKAEMYYQKRPELISQVEEFYRVYRSLAERYDHMTGELRKSVPADLPSPGSVISDVGSEPGSTCPSPDQRSRLKSRHRAAGFDVFLGSGGSHSDVYNKDGDDMSSSLSSESDSDDSSSINNYSSQPVNAGEPELRKKIFELEVELRDTKTKLRMQEVENSDGSSRGGKNGNLDDLVARITEYEYELNATTEKLRCSYEENSGLRMKLQNYGSSEFASGSQSEFESLEKGAEVGMDAENGSNIQEKEEILESDVKVMGLMEELKTTKKRLQDSEKEICSLKKDFESKKSESIRHLQEQLELAKRDNAIWKVKLTAEKREVSKLQERIMRYKTNLSEREQEIRDLKVAVSDAEQNLSLENKQLKAQISKLIDEKTRLVENLEESNLKTRNLEEEIQRVELEKTELEKRLKCDIEQLKSDISEKDDYVKDLNKKLDALTSAHEGLILEKDKLKVKVATLITEFISKDLRIGEMEKHWHQLHVEQAELIVGTEKTQMQVEELRSRVEELEDAVATQKSLIDQGGEDKREAIRQLCYSIEHYRNGYHRLRKAFIGQHKRPAILAT